MIHIFQAPCGSGKSEIIRRLAKKYHDKSFLVLFKNHDNEESWNLGQSYPQTRDLFIYSDIEEMYKLGLNPGQMVYLFINNNLSNDPSVQAYMQKKESFNNARVKKGCIERFFISDDFSEIDTDIVVFDESVIEHAVKIGNITVKDLKTIRDSKLISFNNFSLLMDKLKHSKRFTKSLIKDIQGDIKKDFTTALSISESIKSLNELLNSDYYEWNFDSNKNPRIIYMQNRLNRLDAIANNPKKKVFIFSATPEMTLYNSRFETRLHQLPEADMKSEITFYLPSTTTAQTSLLSMSDKEIIKMLKAAKVGHVKNLMSFKKFIPPPGYNLVNWWGCECGTNDFIGQDLTVIGTFRYPEYVIKFLAKAAGLTFDESKAQWENQTVTIEGYNITGRFMKDDTLRKLEIEMCQNKIIQMMHRGRPITEDVTCTVISDIPLPRIPLQHLP